MDKLIALSGILFFTADIFAIGSLANPDWIVTTGEAGRHTELDYLYLLLVLLIA